MTLLQSVTLGGAVLAIGLGAGLSGPAKTKSMHAIHERADTLRINAAEAIAPEVSMHLTRDAQTEVFTMTFDVTNGVGATNSIAVFAVEPFSQPYGTSDPPQWWGMYSFDGRDSVVAWACMDTLTAVPSDWTQRGATQYMITPGSTKQFVLVPTNLPRVLKMYAQGYEAIPGTGEPARPIFQHGWMGQVILDVTDVGPGTKPAFLELGKPRPNPSQGVVTIGFAIPAESNVKLSIYDVAGGVVRTLVNASEAVGAHIVTWDGRDNRGRIRGTGAYFARLEVNGRQIGTRRIVIVQ